MKNKNDIKNLSTYYHYISVMICKYNVKSFLKLVIVCFILKNNKNIFSSQARKNDIIKEFFSNFKFQIVTLYQEFDIIFSSINVLETEKYIQINGDSINLICNIEYINDDFLESMCVENVLIELEKMSLNSFVEEVLRNV